MEIPNTAAEVGQAATAARVEMYIRPEQRIRLDAVGVGVLPEAGAAPAKPAAPAKLSQAFAQGSPGAAEQAANQALAAKLDGLRDEKGKFDPARMDAAGLPPKTQQELMSADAARAELEARFGPKPSIAAHNTQLLAGIIKNDQELMALANQKDRPVLAQQTPPVPQTLDVTALAVSDGPTTLNMGGMQATADGVTPDRPAVNADYLHTP